MANERYNAQNKESDYFDDDYDNEGYDDLSDDYDDDERYMEGESRRTHNYSGSGPNYDLSDDSRLSRTGLRGRPDGVSCADRKDHHNQLERKRRASIKSSYTELRESIPTLSDKKASRSVILQKAVDYLDELSRRNSDHVTCVEHFTAENGQLESKCREMENQVQLLLRQQRSYNGGALTQQTLHLPTGHLPQLQQQLSQPSHLQFGYGSNGGGCGSSTASSGSGSGTTGNHSSQRDSTTVSSYPTSGSVTVAASATNSSNDGATGTMVAVAAASGSGPLITRGHSSSVSIHKAGIDDDLEDDEDDLDDDLGDLEDDEDEEEDEDEDDEVVVEAVSVPKKRKTVA